MELSFGSSSRDMAKWPRLLQLQYDRETLCVSEGVRRYKEDVLAAQQRGEEIDTPPGVKLSVDILPGLEKAIEKAQSEAVRALSTNAHPLWGGPILYLSAAKIAVITLRTVLGTDYQTKAQSLAWAIATSIRTEREFELWRDAEKAKAKADPEAVDVHGLMIRSIRKVNTRNAKDWMRKTQTWEPIHWTTEQRLSLGATCLQLLVWESNGFFEFVTHTRPRYGRPHSVSTVRLTRIGRSFLDNQHNIVSEWRPWLTPMIVPPRRWERKLKDDKD